MNAPRTILALAATAILLPGIALAQRHPSYHPEYPPPRGWPGPVFELSQDYPREPPPAEDPPWLRIDFKQQPMKYLGAVLDYSLEGNVEVSFRGQDNEVRKWYHAPWLQTRCAGREFIHGLTRERRFRPHEVHPEVDRYVENWAVGLYNPAGGYVLGRFWSGRGGSPIREAADFPVGTVALKLLFTSARPDELPFIRNGYTWQAHIYDNSRENNPCRSDWGPPQRPRVVRDVHLVQVDLAVRDDRSENTGWVFGTFVYSAAATGKTPFERLVPVGLAWGDDSAVGRYMRREGAFVNPGLQQSVVNADLVPPRLDDWGERAYVTHFGLGGRLNGPIDNASSSCISCHARAAVPAIRTVPSSRDVPRPQVYPPALFAAFFANVGQGPVRGDGWIHSDYSLQLAFGAQHWSLCVKQPRSEGCPPGGTPSVPALRLLEPGVPISRDEGDFVVSNASESPF